MVSGAARVSRTRAIVIIKMWFQLIQIEVANLMRQARFRVAEERAGGADSVVT